VINNYFGDELPRIGTTLHSLPQKIQLEQRCKDTYFWVSNWGASYHHDYGSAGRDRNDCHRQVAAIDRGDES